MITLENIHSVADVLVFGLWSLVVWAMANAVFRSLPASMFRRWLLKDLSVPNRQRLNWEIENRRTMTRNPAEQRELTPAEVEERIAERNRLKNPSVFQQLATYLLDCQFCQHFWTAMVLVLVTAGPQAVLTAFGYAAVGTIAGSVLANGPAKPAAPASGGCAGGGCGGQRNPR